MKKRVGFLLLSLCSAIIPLIFLFSQSLSAQSPIPTSNDNKIDPDLWVEIEENEEGDLLRVMIDLRESANLTNIAMASSIETRRYGTVAALQNTAVSSQAALLQNIETLATTGSISEFHPFWIVNKIAVTGNEQAITALANHPDVLAIRPDAQVASIQPPEDDKILSLLQATVAASTAMTGTTWGVERIRAPYVWHGLGIDGDGVTVAIMDSGVDFTHPDLIENYRGNLGGGNFNHADNWLHTSIPTATVPTDTLGHGTHVAGTAVGQHGIGVAPGANWIAVSVADEYGFIYESDVHEGFEWILAPNGNPGLAPDIVNNSWSGYGASTIFLDDIHALHTAGIFPVFAAGNDGPYDGSVGSPASYPDTLAIGASDDTDDIAWFSSQGPSPLTEEIKPWVIAPGTSTYSSLPGGGYGYSNGTSMATPHSVGTIALILSANPTLLRHDVLDILANTAVPVSTTLPNMTHGWGRIDAYSAVLPEISTGNLTGIVRVNGTPQSNITVTISAPTGGELSYVTDVNGRYSAKFINGNYNLAINTFGFFPFSANNLNVQSNQTTTYDINLLRIASGTIRGTVREAQTNDPLPNTIIYIPGIPVTTTTDANGRYTLILPANNYKLHARAAQHRIKHSNILVQVNQETIQDFTLDPTHSILIVDSGKWYFQSQARYYEEALTSLRYPADTWTINHPFSDRPTLEDLAPYDNVIWSSPNDSPGYIEASRVISDYLGLGKNMLISGQNVAYYDGDAFEWWWHGLLRAYYAGNADVSQPIYGAQGTTYENITLTLNGGDSAQNQIYADAVKPQPGALSIPNFYYANGYGAGLQAGQCQPFRLSFLSFGVEAVSDAVDRAAILARSLDYFDSPRTQFGAQFSPAVVDDFALAGDQLVYTLTVRNMSETLTDTFRLNSLSTNWQTNLITDSLTLGPCQLGKTVLRITVSDDAPKDYDHVTRVTAVSGNNPSVQENLILNHKTPGQILFVDDDRWFDYEDKLTETLDHMGLQYDVWQTGYNQRGRGSPSSAFLNQYEFVIWYTGYDWFAPVLDQERDDLTNYLAQGGRLFLTSQDFLAHHENSVLARTYFDVQNYWDFWERESRVVPTAVFAEKHSALDDTLAGPLQLDYSVYQNHMDAVIPFQRKNAFFWHDRGYPAGTATQGDNWRAAFLAYPLELLETAERRVAMNRIMGWLTDFGESTFAVDTQTAPSGEPRTYTITLRNASAGLNNNHVIMTNALPPELTLNQVSVTGGASYNASTHQLIWQGNLDKNESHLITYEATPDNTLSVGTAVTNTISIHDTRHNIHFEKTATIWVDAPDLSYSVVTAVPNKPFAADTITYTFQLQNSGLSAAHDISATMPFFNHHWPLPDTLTTSAGTAVLGDHRVYWQGNLAPQENITVSLAVTQTVLAFPIWIPATGIMDDGLTRTILHGDMFILQPHTQYLPLITQNK